VPAGRGTLRQEVRATRDTDRAGRVALVSMKSVKVRRPRQANAAGTVVAVAVAVFVVVVVVVMETWRDAAVRLSGAFADAVQGPVARHVLTDVSVVSSERGRERDGNDHTGCVYGGKLPLSMCPWSMCQGPVVAVVASRAGHV
jgi:hypothetical protein